MFLLIAWWALDPSWRARAYGKGALFILILVLLPVWIRVPLLAGIAAECMRIGVHRLSHSFDSKPDFTIGPDGVGEVGLYNKFKVIPWDQIESITQDDSGIRILQKIPPGNALVRFLTGGQYGAIVYNKWFFDRDPREIMKTLSLYRPDLTKDFDPNA